MPRINVLPQGVTIECPTGANLMEQLAAAGMMVDVPCGGRGMCGKCAVMVSGREALSCQYVVDSDVSVNLPGTTSEMQDILTFGHVPPFSRDAFEPGFFGIAIDIGTTTVACTLVNLSTGMPLESVSGLNEQSRYGADVLTRITYEIEKGDEAIGVLQRAIVSSIDAMICDLLERADAGGESVARVAIAANCTMMHLLLGEDARPLGRAPYMPRFMGSRRISARDLGLESISNAKVYCLPSVSAYVGADVVAGVRACEMAGADDVALLVDIGTNGEIVLSNRGVLSCCSCAAGPALEGMNISWGMQAAPGAVQDMTIGKESVELDVIGGGKPRGLCGSGILAAVRELVEWGLVKKNGAFVKLEEIPEGDFRKRLMRLNGKKREFVFGPEDCLLAVTQSDVRQVQLAKGAILSGFLALLNQAGLDLSDVDRVIVAGQFGAHLPAESLTGVGLLPASLSDRIVYVGNSSKSGAYMALLSKSVRDEMDELAQRISSVELADVPGYERLFAQCTLFEEGR